MAITILPLELEDIPYSSESTNRAFKDDLLIKAMLPEHMTAQQQTEHTNWRNDLTADRIKYPNSHYFKAVHSEGRTVGWSGWQGPKPKDYVSPARYGTMPEFVNKPLMEGVAKKLKEGKEKVLGEKGQDVWYLQIMTVDPEFQGQGIGSQMVQDGFERLVGEGECYLESSPVAMKMYEKLGFERRMDVSVLGGDDDYVIVLMVRPKVTER